MVTPRVALSVVIGSASPISVATSSKGSVLAVGGRPFFRFILGASSSGAGGSGCFRGRPRLFFTIGLGEVETMGEMGSASGRGGAGEATSSTGSIDTTTSTTGGSLRCSISRAPRISVSMATFAANSIF